MRTSRNPENTIPSQNPQKETTYTAFDHFEHSLSTTLCNVPAPLYEKLYVICCQRCYVLFSFTYYSYYIAQNDVDIYVVRTLAAFVCGIIAFMIERFVTNDKLKHGYRSLSFFSRVCFVLCRPVMFDTC